MPGIEGELMPGKRVQFDDETWRNIDLLGRDQMKDFQELADEAFRDLLKKHGRSGKPQGSIAAQCRRRRDRASAEAGQKATGYAPVILICAA